MTQHRYKVIQPVVVDRPRKPGETVMVDEDYAAKIGPRYLKRIPEKIKNPEANDSAGPEAAPEPQPTPARRTASSSTRKRAAGNSAKRASAPRKRTSRR